MSSFALGIFLSLRGDGVDEKALVSRRVDTVVAAETPFTDELP